MRYRFDQHEIDVALGELRSGGVPVAIEPRVFALLCLLVEQRERLVTRDELIEKVWEGRIVSEAAIASCLKSARRALGDDGIGQRYIRTLHGRGLRFVAPVSIAVDAVSLSPVGVADEGATSASNEPHTSRPSIAVLPFTLLGDTPGGAVLADALPQELIAALARLRWLFVIARGSSFRFRERDPDVVAVGRALNVRYLMTGTIEAHAQGFAVTTELADTRDGGVRWSERAAIAIDEIHVLRAALVDRIVNALELNIPLFEAKRARLADPANIDAWSAYHLGLQHGWRFNQHDNALALGFFERALRLDPHFARAHAGVSFSRFQSAFLRYSATPDFEAKAARAAAERAVTLDADDPFANFTLGRAHWLEGDLAGSLVWLERATTLSPSYAQGLYARGWTQTLAGDATAGRASVDLAFALSPLDPLAYAMLGTRALSHLVLGEYVDAAHFGERAARTPGAHALIAMIAALCHGLAGHRDAAARWARDVRERRPDLDGTDFLRAFPFTDAALGRAIGEMLGRLGW